jgi:hypothetical protein
MTHYNWPEAPNRSAHCPRPVVFSCSYQLSVGPAGSLQLQLPAQRGLKRIEAD